MRPGYGGGGGTPPYRPPRGRARAGPRTVSAAGPGPPGRGKTLIPLHRAARAAVLVAPVRPALRCAREVEVEVRRPSCRPGRASQDDAEDVAVLVLADQLSEREQLAPR